MRERGVVVVEWSDGEKESATLVRVHFFNFFSFALFVCVWVMGAPECVNPVVANRVRVRGGWAREGKDKNNLYE